jgi:hypothetical protein
MLPLIFLSSKKTVCLISMNDETITFRLIHWCMVTSFSYSIMLRLFQCEYWPTMLSSYWDRKRSRNLAISLHRGIIFMTVVFPWRS